MKRYSVSLIREIQIQTILMYHFSRTILSKFKNIDNVDNKHFHALLVEIKKWHESYGENLSVSTHLHMHLSFDPTMLLLLGFTLMTHLTQYENIYARDYSLQYYL